MLEELNHYTPFQLLVATLLSARTKDSTTIPIVKKLFAKYPGPQELLSLPLPILERELYGIGFYRTKAFHIHKLCSIILYNYHSKVPDTLEELTSLPGVGRKTANCMLNYAFQKPAIAVDTHVHRIANRLGWIKTKTPHDSETALEKLIPKAQWIHINKLLVGHGQTICRPTNPLCTQCPILKYCDYGRQKMK